MMNKTTRDVFFITAVFLFICPQVVSAFTSSKECKKCHEEIYNEWEATPHAKSYTNGLFKKSTDNYRKKKCLQCHAPEPLLETGIDKDPVLREENRDEGVDCLTCHKFEDEMHGTLKANRDYSKASCNQVYDEKFEEGTICFSCHKKEATEWKETEYPKNGETCLTCHMGKIKGEATEGKMEKDYGEHRWVGGKNPLLLELVIKDIELSQEEDNFVVKFKPNKVGHNFPTGTSGKPSFHILLVVMDHDKKVIKSFRKNFTSKNDKDEEDTSIKSGEEVALTFSSPVQRGLLNFVVFYKNYPNQSDSNAILLKNLLYEFDEA